MVWIGSLRQQRFLQQYRATAKVFCIYVLEIPSDKVCKIGRSSRLRHRMQNARSYLYQPHAVHIIRCSSAEESRDLDRYLKKTFFPKVRVGEFFNISLSDVEAVLEKSPFCHLSFSTEEENENQPLYKPDKRIRSPEYSITIS